MYQIDQSGKIEQTERHTVIAFTNSKNYSVLLKKTEKRLLQRFFKDAESLNYFPYFTFAVLIAILIKEVKPKYKITIDKEYYGHEELILKKITLYLEILGIKKSPNLEFGHIGKLSKAHNYGYRVAMKKEKPSKIISAKEVMAIILGTKKSVNDRLTQE